MKQAWQIASLLCRHLKKTQLQTSNTELKYLSIQNIVDDSYEEDDDDDEDEDEGEEEEGAGGVSKRSPRPERWSKL